MELEEAKRRLTRDLPRFPHKLTNDLITVVGDYYQEHVRRDVRGFELSPASAWALIHGFLLAGRQAYAAICILLAEKRPKPLLLQAAVINRSLFESLTTVTALLERPEERLTLLLRDSYRTNAMLHRSEQTRYSGDARWKDHLEVTAAVLAEEAIRLGLPQELVDAPETIPEWPTPGRMIFGDRRRKLRPFLSGSRLKVLRELYDTHYGTKSSQAHGRTASAAIAMLVEYPEEQWSPAQNVSNHVSAAQIFLACLWSEVTAAAPYASHPKLLELWRYLREIDGEAQDLWVLRYEGLLTGPDARTGG